MDECGMCGIRAAWPIAEKRRQCVMCGMCGTHYAGTREQVHGAKPTKPPQISHAYMAMPHMPHMPHKSHGCAIPCFCACRTPCLTCRTKGKDEAMHG